MAIASSLPLKTHQPLHWIQTQSSPPLFTSAAAAAVASNKRRRATSLVVAASLNPYTNTSDDSILTPFLERRALKVGCFITSLSIYIDLTSFPFFASYMLLLLDINDISYLNSRNNWWTWFRLGPCYSWPHTLILADYLWTSKFWQGKRFICHHCCRQGLCIHSWYCPLALMTA